MTSQVKKKTFYQIQTYLLISSNQDRHLNQGAGARVPTLEPGFTKGTWGQKGTDHFDKKSRIFG